MRRRLLAACVILAAGGCGDPATDDDRGYTKAPLENPGLFIESTEEHRLWEYGRPELPQAVEVTPPQDSPAPAGS